MMQQKSLIYRLLLPLLVAAIIFLPALPATAATPTTMRGDTVTGAVLDPGKAPNPFSGRTLQPLALIPRTANTATITSTVAATFTVPLALNEEPITTVTPPAANAFAAWNSRPAVTRADAYPVRIEIPALKVDTFVEALGQRADGSMATPTNPSNVAWYSYGAIPGENGNVVMAGHLDRVDGSPAVFWDLGKLQTGDAVVIYDRTGTAYHYVVTGQQSYPYNEAPLDAIFGFDLVSRLNLITCRGTWDRNRQTYSQRLVVYTELKEIVPVLSTKQ